MRSRRWAPDERNSALTLERWRTIEPIIDAALDLPSAQRRAYVRATCTDDPSLLAIVERLLATHDEPSEELDLPAAQRFSSLLEDAPLNLPEYSVVGIALAGCWAEAAWRRFSSPTTYATNVRSRSKCFTPSLPRR